MSQSYCVGPCFQEKWVMLLENAAYFGAILPTGYAPKATGHFVALRAVWRSGGVCCGTSICPAGPVQASSYPWQMCQCANLRVAGAKMCTPWDMALATLYSFELKVGDSYVVKQPNWYLLPPECSIPKEPAGDIICNTTFSIRSGELLRPTWFEPGSGGVSTFDNSGTIYIDLYGIHSDSYCLILFISVKA